MEVWVGERVDKWMRGCVTRGGGCVDTLVTRSVGGRTEEKAVYKCMWCVKKGGQALMER